MPADFSERCLILAPRGRDANVAAAILAEAGITSGACASIPALADALNHGAGFAVVTDEALRRADLRPLVSWIEAQPEWSDFPFILLTNRGGGVERNPAATRFLRTLGNVSFLERPFHPTTLVSMSHSALRGRRRQYEARARLADLHQHGERLREANETLENRVRERTGALEDAYRKVIEESTQRANAEEQLRQIQKLEMIGHLTGGIAHDFNNLLTAVLGNLSLIQKHLPASDLKGQRFVAGAIQGATRGAALTQRLLAFARRQSLEVVPTDVVDLVTGMKGLLERSVGPGITLKFDLAQDHPVAMVDANQVELAILNLAVNARDAMPDGGELRIGVDRKQATGDLPDGDYVRIWISDTGSGMDETTLQHSIEPFFSTKELGKGTGLGLSMVHGLAIQLHGGLRLHSAVGQGTRAELYFPATRHDAAIRENHPAEAAPALRHLRILLVDDDPLVAMSSVDMLEDLGHEVIEANSGKEALELLRSRGPFDLLITDFAMPGMNGAQLIEAAKQLYPDLPVLLATGYAEIPGKSVHEVPRIGKPYSQSQLGREIARLLETQPA
ncbi:MAG TPA: response regulator [Micropepsaceae bacterium]|nr:response regulator [Micropepsaceae bacterium]